uniref:MFS transporter n=1 Tax=Blastomonas sp. TaxID=1909299 RepID=UPI0035945EEC
TGKRTEGIYFAGFFFMQKCVGGLGILVSSLILTSTGFPDGAQPGAVEDDVLDRLAVTFAIITAIIGAACAYMFTRFPLGRADHEARLAEIATR